MPFQTLLHETSTNASSTISELERSKEENRKLTSECTISWLCYAFGFIFSVAIVNVYQAALHKSKNKIEQLSQFEDGKVDRLDSNGLYVTCIIII